MRCTVHGHLTQALETTEERALVDDGLPYWHETLFMIVGKVCQ